MESFRNSNGKSPSKSGKPKRGKSGTELGISLIELLMAVSLLAILAITAISTINETDVDARHRATVETLNQIKTALIGDPNATENGVRSSFGFAGDVGAMPTNAQGLDALVNRPAAISAFAPSTATRLGVGWKGPYIRSQGLSTTGFQDGWFTNLVYSNASPATITSYGADAASGGTGWAGDITISIPDSDWKGSVFGYISNNGAPYTSNATVVISYPSGTGTVTNVSNSVSNTASGYFTFSSVPYGRRSITIYIPSSSSPTKTIGPLLITVAAPQVEVNDRLIDVANY